MTLNRDFSFFSLRCVEFLKRYAILTSKQNDKQNSRKKRLQSILATEVIVRGVFAFVPNENSTLRLCSIFSNAIRMKVGQFWFKSKEGQHAFSIKFFICFELIQKFIWSPPLLQNLLNANASCFCVRLFQTQPSV